MLLDFKDEQLCETLNHVISGLLPHENYDPQSFSLLYPTLIGVLSKKDSQRLYYAFYSVFDKYFALESAVNSDKFLVNITKERFSNALANNLPDLILEPQLHVDELMGEEGKSGDISIPTIQQEAMGVVYEKLMALYDECFELAQSYEDAMAYIIDLKDSVKSNLIETGLQAQRAIMSTGLKNKGTLHRGTSGWAAFTQQLVREISELDASSQDDLRCNGLEILAKIEEEAEEMSMGLAPYGIPQLDDYTPMLRHRLAVIVAKENTGKTQIVTHLVASMIRAGVKPFFACGELPPKPLFLRVVSSYIFQEYGMFFDARDLLGEGLARLQEEDRQIVQTAKARVAMSGLIISNKVEYDTLTATFTEAYHNGCEAFFIDHTQSLRGRRGRKIGDLVTGLALDCREFKNNFPVYVCMTSQPSTNLKEILQKDQTKNIQQSPTAQSAAPSQEADELFIINDSDYLNKQNLLQWIVFKRRGAAKPQAFFIKKLFHVASYLYDPNLQSGDTMDAQELEGIMKTIGTGLDDIYGDDDEDNLNIEF